MPDAQLGADVNPSLVAPGFAQVVVLAQLGRAGGLYTYGLPAGLAALVSPGSLVRIPFTNRQFQGVVYSLETSTDLPRVRAITELLDPVPVVTAHQLLLARWIADYYAAPLSDVLGAMLPPGIGRKTVYMLELTCPGYPLGDTRAGNRLSADQRLVVDYLSCPEGARRVSQDDVQHALPDLDVERIVKSLTRRGVLLRMAELSPPRVAARRQRWVSITDEGTRALQEGTDLRRAARQRAALAEVALRQPVLMSDVTQVVPGAQAALAALLKKGMVQIAEHEVHRSPLEGKTYPPPGIPLVSPARHLSLAQAEAYTVISRSLAAQKPDIYLLHGVTGSGKTEVYLQAAQAALQQRRQVVFMVPEISLTPQAIERVASRFPGRVAILHSQLSPGERVDEWQRIRHGEVDIVVGPRSALFAPLARPGLLIVDEEHDPSYKQDASPRYNARDAAAVLGRLTNATVVFGSATPDVGTHYAGLTGRVTILPLPDRPVWGPAVHREHPAQGAPAPAPRPMPKVRIVDMRQELKLGNRGIFSDPLLEALRQTLTAGHQALLFLNRRGSATVVLCRDCGFVVRCPNCDIPLTYHASASRLICHRCDKRTISPRICPACQSPRIRYLGVGTQRVEEEVARLFPQARVLRWDRDVTADKGASGPWGARQILQSFAHHEADILVGTQMIAKGLDFPLVTLVGVISADSGLHMPDFRAPERSFQLLTQVAGRAGRASLPSSVIVQTYTPDHYAIQAAKDHDYARFYREEMSFRESARYPPFARLVRFIYSGESAAGCRQSAEQLRGTLERAIQEGIDDIELIGPAPCFVARVKNRYYWQLIARGVGGKHGSDLHPLLDYVPAGWAIDVDPVDLL